MDKRIISLMLVVVSICSLLAGCGTVENKTQPNKAAQTTDKIFPSLSIEELCTLPLNDVKQLEYRGIRNILSEEDWNTFLNYRLEKQKERSLFWVRSMKSADYECLCQNLIWTPEDENLFSTVVDCITGIVYNDLEGKTVDEIKEFVYAQREELGLHYSKNLWYFNEFEDGFEGFPYELEGRSWYDTWSKREYTSPIDLYLGRREAGVLMYALGLDVYDKLDKSELYTARPISEIEAWEKVKEAEARAKLDPPPKDYSKMNIDELCALPFGEMAKVYGTEIFENLSNMEKEQFEKEFSQKTEKLTDSGTYHVHRNLHYSMMWTPEDEGYCETIVDCLTGVIYEVPPDYNLDEIKDYVKTQRAKLGLTQDVIDNGNFIIPLEINDSTWYDPWTREEYSNPLEMYLAREEGGVLHRILGEELIEKLANEKRYN